MARRSSTTNLLSSRCRLGPTWTSSGRSVARLLRGGAVNDNMIPARGKVSGLYVNSSLAKTEAVESGFDEAIMLTEDGHVSEGTGENVFLPPSQWRPRNSRRERRHP